MFALHGLNLDPGGQVLTKVASKQFIFVLGITSAKVLSFSNVLGFTLAEHIWDAPQLNEDYIAISNLFDIVPSNLVSNG